MVRVVVVVVLEVLQCSGGRGGRWRRYLAASTCSAYAAVAALFVLLVLDLVHVVDRPGVPSPRHPVLPDRRQHHPLVEALLEAAVLAPVPLRLVDLAVAVGNAVVDPLVLHRSLEEALAALAGDDAVVQPRRLVLADHADERLLVLVGNGKVGGAAVGVGAAAPAAV